MNNRIRFSVLAIAYCLSFQNYSLLAQARKDAKMECKLIVQNMNLLVGETPRGEVEIKNTAKQDLIITYNTDPWEFLDMEVIDPAGKKISFGKYGGRFSPSSPGAGEKRIILRPGETHRRPVAVFGNTKEDDLTTPGVYRITAVFEYNKERAVAKQVELTVTSK